MPVWTVDTSKVKPGREPHFLQNCGALSPAALTLFRDLEKPGFFWSPATWEGRDMLDEWRKSDRYRAALSVVKEDVLKHVTHLMENVPEFPPQRSRHIMRHAVATLAYRGSRVLRDAPNGFSSFACGGGCRSAGAILAHIGDLLDWALLTAKGKREWHDTEPHPWADEVNRFHNALAAFDSYLASDQPLQAPIEKLLQGPIADALTHIGQIAMMRRLAGAPIKSESYFVAEITVGRVALDQVPPQQEFD